MKSQQIDVMSPTQKQKRKRWQQKKKGKEQRMEAYNENQDVLLFVNAYRKKIENIIQSSLTHYEVRKLERYDYFGPIDESRHIQYY